MDGLGPSRCAAPHRAHGQGVWRAGGARGPWPSPTSLGTHTPRNPRQHCWAHRLTSCVILASCHALPARSGTRPAPVRCTGSGGPLPPVASHTAAAKPGGPCFGTDCGGCHARGPGHRTAAARSSASSCSQHRMRGATRPRTASQQPFEASKRKPDLGGPAARRVEGPGHDDQGRRLG